MNKQNIEDLFVNPYYTINISPILSEKHDPIVDKEKWIAANTRLMKEIGQEEWLKRLLDILESGTIPN